MKYGVNIIMKTNIEDIESEVKSTLYWHKIDVLVPLEIMKITESIQRLRR
jgi:hypothetical protein